MRWLLLPLALLVVASLAGLTPVAAQDAAGRLVLDDEAGDVAGPVPAAGVGFVDLTRVEVEATDAGLGVWITVASLQQDAVAQLGWELWLALEYDGDRFDVLLEPASTTLQPPDEVDRVLFGSVRATLLRMDDDARMADLTSAEHPATRTFNTTVPWDAITSRTGSNPAPGEPVRLLAGASAWTSLLLGTPHNPFPLGGVDAFVSRDDAAFPDGTFLSRPGAVGDLSLSTPMPIRFSNGEATTFVWPLTLTNRGSTDLTATLTVDSGDLPVLSPPSIQVPAGNATQFNVSVAVPFGHQHGAQHVIAVQAEASATQRVRLQLGIDYPAIAQPAGHHPRLYLHVGQSTLFQVKDIAFGVWMNTLEEEGVADAVIGGDANAVCPRAAPDLSNLLDWGTLWLVDLQPALRMGLAARVDEPATLDVVLDSLAATPAGAVHAQIFVATGPVEPFDLFQGNRTWGTTPLAAATGPGRTAVHVDIPLAAELARVAPNKASNLYLAVLVCPDLPPVAGSALTIVGQFASLLEASPFNLVAGGQLVLPLDEYHDAVPQDLAVDPTSGAAEPDGQARKQSPAPPLLAALALALLLRRRQ